ncbi:hypothetical protein [uncultured Methylobacterium sp.]|jgi:hypothetical protein|uniref:hypothetical protein n=1 Tax=uncultured Methylobacterium sp. TaxID=157278 RepID=UPI002614F2B0|nr:hypothetical protein [uncultured Methylobacterium sp.]
MTGSKTSTQTTTTQQKSDPWAPAQPALQKIITGAGEAYASGAGQGVYQGPRTAGLGPTTNAGLDFLTENAGAGLDTAQGANGLASNLIRSGGQTAGTKAASDAFSGIGRVDTAPTAALAARASDPAGLASTVANRLGQGNTVTTEGDYRGLMSGLSGPSQTRSSLQAVADGKFLGGSNPYLDDIVSRSNATAASDVAQRFAASGRYGSGAFSNAIADATSANESRLRYQDYDAERARQASAATAIDSADNARTGLASGILGNITTGQAQNASLATQGAQLGMANDAQALAAVGQLAGQQATNAGLDATRAQGLAGIATGDRAASLQAAGMVPGIQDALLAPGRTLAGAGAVQDAARQEAIDADMARFNEQDTAAWRPLGLYSSIVNPIAGMGGTASGTSETKIPQPSIFQQILGGISSGIGALGATGAFPTSSASGWLVKR